MGMNSKTPNLFFVDTEATSQTPYSGVMTEYGIVNLNGEECYSHLWPFTPHPDITALPVVEKDAQPLVNLDEDAKVLDEWVRSTGNGRPIFVSDNPAYDFMWIAHHFDASGLKNPFGFSARRIGDLYAGLRGNWRDTQGWKKYRKTGHDHNPLNDAKGNREAFLTIMDKYGLN